MRAVSVRTHLVVGFANPYMACSACGGSVRGFHAGGPDDPCGCERGDWLSPCGDRAQAVSRCMSWDPVDGCGCASPCRLGDVV